MSTWLVTGGAGFIGSTLADGLLAAGHQVRVLDDLSSGRRANLAPQIEFIHGDVTDPGLLQRAVRGVDGVFHLAAIASVARCTEAWAASHAVNQTGTVAVLEAARRVGGLPVIYASSAAVYGDTEREKLAETDPTRPLSAYGADKLGSELHARVARRSFDIPTLGLRLFNVYGPRQDGSSPYSGVISIFRRRVQAGETLVLYGDGRQTRDFVYVADVVAAMIAGMARLSASPSQRADLPEALNVCTGRVVTVQALALLLCELAGQPPLLRHAPAKVGDIGHSCGDPALLTASLGVTCRIGLREGLQRMALTDFRARRPGARDGLGRDIGGRDLIGRDSLTA